MHRVRHLIAISHYVTDYFFPELPPRLKIYYIPNAVDLRFFNLDGGADEATVLYAGRVIPLKRVSDLVRAFALVVQRVPHASLRIAGETSSEPAYVNAVRKQISMAHLDSNVQLLGPLPEAKLLDEYQRCTVVALASAQENFPMVLAQAMASGKPVVATCAGGVPEMVGNNERGMLVNVGDIQGLAEAMTQLLQDQPLRAALGRNAQAYARENYHQDRVAGQTFEVYQKILKNDA